MKNLILKYGLGAGAFLALTMGLTINGMRAALEGGTDSAEIWGYASMVIAFSVIFFAVKHHRDRTLDGEISFAEGVKIGLLITIIASVIYVIAWMILSSTFYPDFMEDYARHTLSDLENSGVGAAEIAAEKEKMNKFIEWYKNPVIKAGMTFIEPLPVGLLLTLLSALILKKNNSHT